MVAIRYDKRFLSNIIYTFFLILFQLLAPIYAQSSTGQVQIATGIYDNSTGSPLIKLISSSKKSIDIMIYQMDDDQVRTSLRQAIKRGVKIRVIQEPTPIGHPCKIFTASTSDDSENCRDQKKLVKEVKKSRGAYVPFNKAELCGVIGKSCYQHGKIVLIDRSFAMISTGNFNSTSLCDLSQKPGTCNRDYSVVSNDQDTVRAMENIFEKDLLGKSYNLKSIVTSALAKKITVSPISLDAIVQFIGTAKKSIQIQNQYLHEPNINNALIAASHRGVKVEITVSSVCSFGYPRSSTQELTTNIFTDFDHAKISSQMFTRKIKVGGKPGYLHAKAIVVDKKRAWVGSMNGSTLSATRNREFGIFFDNSKWVHTLSSIMSSDQDNENGESWEDSLSCLHDR
ncbi:MAG: hypothetical protein HQK51_08290 [Oligoflexia bacterium]|nr:hypothetical protein [Oligoflexia bacterium]